MLYAEKIFTFSLPAEYQAGISQIYQNIFCGVEGRTHILESQVQQTYADVCLHPAYALAQLAHKQANTYGLFCTHLLFNSSNLKARCSKQRQMCVYMQPTH